MRPWLLRADQCRTLTLRIIEESLKLPPRLWRLAHRSTRGAGAQRRWLDTTEKDAHRIAAPHARAAQGTLPVHRLRGHGPGAKRGPLNACKNGDQRGAGNHAPPGEKKTSPSLPMRSVLALLCCTAKSTALVVARPLKVLQRHHRNIRVALAIRHQGAGRLCLSTADSLESLAHIGFEAWCVLEG